MNVYWACASSTSRPFPRLPASEPEIRGLDLREPLTDSQREELDRALVEFKVLFFRAQPLTPEQQADFARGFGELEIHPFLPDDGKHPEVAHFRNDEEVVGVENVWHSDVSWRQIPSLGSVLRAREVPPVGGDTLWCDMEAVYTGLPDELKTKIEGRKATTISSRPSATCCRRTRRRSGAGSSRRPSTRWSAPIRDRDAGAST